MCPSPASPESQAQPPSPKGGKRASKAAATAPETLVAAVDQPPPAKESKTRKPAAKKPKLVRDSFTFPEADYALIAQLKKRALVAGREAKKSEILRAALANLAGLPVADLVKALDAIEKLSPGRPAS